MTGLRIKLRSLSWSQYVFLISINSDDERRFYEIEAADNGWTLQELKRQFNSGLYERKGGLDHIHPPDARPVGSLSTGFIPSDSPGKRLHVGLPDV